MRPRTRNLNIPSDQEILELDNVPVETAARYLGSSTATLYEALQDERFPSAGRYSTTPTGPTTSAPEPWSATSGRGCPCTG